MQSIDLELVDENNQVIKSSLINFADVVGGILWKIDDFDSKYPWLSAVDPYGMTWLNPKQAKFMVTELEHLKSEKISDVEKDLIENVIEFCRAQEVHTYLRFNGD